MTCIMSCNEDMQDREQLEHITKNDLPFSTLRLEAVLGLIVLLAGLLHQSCQICEPE